MFNQRVRFLGSVALSLAFSLPGCGEDQATPKPFVPYVPPVTGSDAGSGDAGTSWPWPDTQEPGDGDADAASDESTDDLDAGALDSGALDSGALDSGAPDGATGDGDESDAGTVELDADTEEPDADTGEPDAGEGPPPALPTGTAYANGWTWVETAGALCRDGSKAGYYYRKGTENALMIFLNGGGACADKFFCGLNPANVNQNLPIEFLSHGTFDLLAGVRAERQQAPEEGVFKRSATANPVRNWSMIFVPYCTGDIHSGTRKNVQVKDVAGVQQFVGYTNYGLFLESFGPSFRDVDQVLLTGSSAGGFGSLFNADRTQEYFKQFGSAKVMTVSDSGVPFQDAYMAPCLQKRWRDTWGLNDILPADCTDCFQADGGGLVKGYGNWLFNKKYKDRMLGGFLSSREDEIIRAFYAPGLNATAGQPDNCTLDPSGNTLQEAIFGGGPYTGAKFSAGLKDVIDNVVGRDKVGYYTTSGTAHMHLWRPRFFEKNGNSITMADWLRDILAEKATHAGTL